MTASRTPVFSHIVRQLLLSLTLLVSSSAFAQSYSTISNLEYANVRGHSLQLDLRVPDGRGPFPVIVFLHSGAWITGDRTGGPAIRQATRGYAVASIDYELAPQSIWPAQIEDAKAAVRWVRANAARFNLDPNRVGVWGDSAGGHIAAVLGTSGGDPSLEGVELGNAQFSSRVKAVVDLFGPTDLLKLDDQKLACFPGLSGNASYMPPSLLMGCPIQECKEKTELANPIHYVDENDPPFLIMHGVLDCLVPFQQSVMLDAALKSAGVDEKLVLLPTAQHADKQFNEPKYQQIEDEWLDKHLKGESTSTPPPSRRRAVHH